MTEIRAYEGPAGGPRSDVNQFLLLLKPDLLDPRAGVDVGGCLDLVLSHLRDARVRVGGVRVFAARYAREHRLVERTYATLNLVARQGPAALSDHAQLILAERTLGLSQPTVVGGYDFLRKQPAFSAESLCVLANNLPVEKLAAGAYAHVIDVFGSTQVVLNAFHPHQLAGMTRAKTALVAFECWSTAPFEWLRERVVGSVQPSTAASDSLRRMIFERRGELSVAGGSPQRNYVHISPGPAEAAAHLLTYFGGPLPLDVGRTNLGALLAARGVSGLAGEWLAGNPEVMADGRRRPLFDLSEDTDTMAFVRLVGRLVADNQWAV